MGQSAALSIAARPLDLLAPAPARPQPKASGVTIPAMTREEAVIAVLRDYFDGLRHRDTRRLRRVYHPQALCATFSGGQARLLRVDEYLATVEARPSPASRSAPGKDAIVSIEFTGPETASVRLRSGSLPPQLTNLLTLAFVDGRWQAIAEVFGWETASSFAGAV